jgi:hypothetical protein
MQILNKIRIKYWNIKPFMGQILVTWELHLSFYVNIEENLFIGEKYRLTKTDRAIKTAFWQEYGEFNEIGGSGWLNELGQKKIYVCLRSPDLP